MTERTILHSIAAGHLGFEDLMDDLKLHPRILSECLAALFEAEIIEFREGSRTFGITPLAREALQDPEFVPSTLRVEPWTAKIVVDRVTGLADLAKNVSYMRTDELVQRGIRFVEPSDIDPTPGRSVVEALVQADRGGKSNEWVRSYGRPRPIHSYNSVVQVDIDGGRVQGLRSAQWRWALAQALGARGLQSFEEPKPEPAAAWIRVPRADLRAIWGAEEHSRIIEEALSTAYNYVFIHSAFLTGRRTTELAEHISRAVARGVDVIVARGVSGDESTSDEEGIVALRKLAYDVSGFKGRFSFELYPTGSHAKILLRDDKEVIIGSFNWLSTPRDSRRQELSLRLFSVPLAEQLCDIAADLLHGRGALWPAQVLRKRRREHTSFAKGTDDLSVRVLVGAESRACLFEYAEAARQRLLIYSDKVTSRSDPMLHEKLFEAARTLALRGGLNLRYASIDGEGAPLLDGLAAVGARLSGDGLNHAKGIVMDSQCALVTSFNLLSFGGQSMQRSAASEIGIEVKAALPDPVFFDELS